MRNVRVSNEMKTDNFRANSIKYEQSNAELYRDRLVKWRFSSETFRCHWLVGTHKLVMRKDRYIDICADLLFPGNCPFIFGSFAFFHRALCAQVIALTLPKIDSDLNFGYVCVCVSVICACCVHVFLIFPFALFQYIVNLVSITKYVFNKNVLGHSYAFRISILCDYLLFRTIDSPKMKRTTNKSDAKW